ncbi:MAG: ribosome biogenesis GTPase YlqF [Clostridia bacterium]|nr:ribosome biogenesis GTPase YlqF [Clostridia bacterium]
MTYNWFPGHMARAKRMLAEQMSLVDVVAEVADARLPLSSRNPDLIQLCGNKPRILVLNKADLADPAVTAKWLERFKNSGEIALALTATRRAEAQKAAKLMETAAAEAVARAAARGMRKTVRGMVVGVPNCGKSSLINSLRGNAVAATADKPGVTRGKQWVKITPYFELLDTPGLLWPRIDDHEAALRLALTGAMRDDAFDVEELARTLLKTIGNENSLEDICKQKGWLQKGGVSDTLRGARTLLDQFRGGKWGRITLETP